MVRSQMAITDDSLDKPVAVTVVLFVPDERSFLPADYGDVVRLHRVTYVIAIYGKRGQQKRIVAIVVVYRRCFTCRSP